MSTPVQQRVDAILSLLGIEVERYSHRPVFTSLGAAEMLNHPPEMGTKTLLLRAKSGKLYVATTSTIDRLPFDVLASKAGEKRLRTENRLETLSELGVMAGGLSPFGFSPQICILVSESLYRQPFIYFNPGTNVSTYRVTGEDFRRICTAEDAKLF